MKGRTIMPEEKRKTTRRTISTKVELYVDEDIIDATTIDLSEKGIRFSISNPILVRMRYVVDGTEYEQGAHLVWAGRDDSGGQELGLEFLESDD